MKELRSHAGTSQAWVRIYWGVPGHMHTSFLKGLFRAQSHLSSIYVLSQCKFTVVHLPTGAAGEQPSPQTFLTKKQVKSLTTQLQQMTRERNELWDHLISITEEPINNRHSLFQAPWWLSWFHTFTLNLFPLRFGLWEAAPSRCPLAQHHAFMLPKRGTRNPGRSKMGT